MTSPARGLSADASAPPPAVLQITAELQTVLDALPYYVMLIDAQHRILLANEAVQRDLGRKPREILGLFCPEVVHGSCGAYEGCPLEQSLRTRGVVEVESRDAATGRQMWSGIYPTRYRTESGQQIYLHTARDVTERHEVAQRLQQSHEVQCVVSDVLQLALGPASMDEVLQQVLDRLLSLSWVATNPRGGIYLWDAGRGRLELRAHRGIDPAALERCSLIAPGDGLCGRVAQSRQVEVEPKSDPCGNPSQSECVGNCCVPVMHGDELLGVLGVCFDLERHGDSTEAQLLLSVANVLAGVIERKRVERLKLEHERVALARERMARVGALSAGLAHTVRNPLHGVMSCLEILEGQARRGQPAADEIIALMRDGLHRIERTTRRLLGLTRDVAPVRKPVRVDVLLQDVVDIMRLQARDRSVALELGDAWAGEAMLDPDGVVEALSAVVTNALLACKAGGKVVVSARLSTAAPGLLCIEVRDDGVGIAEQDLPRVLEPFFTTRPVTEASGLGLAIARRIMDEHQGEIELASQLGQGTTVCLTFPSALDGPTP